MINVGKRLGKTMKFLIAGAGAIGAYIGARMAQAGFDVTLFARGPHLRAMQERGVQVKSSGGRFRGTAHNRQLPGRSGPSGCCIPWREGARPAATRAAIEAGSGPEPPSSARRMEFLGGISRDSAANGKECVWNASIPAA